MPASLEKPLLPGVPVEVIADQVDAEYPAYLPAEIAEFVPDAPTADVLDEPYPCWSAETSRVISGPLGLNAKFPGKRFMEWTQAKAHVKGKYRMYQFWTVAGRWFARIHK